MGLSLSLASVWLVEKSLRGEYLSEPERLLLRVIFWPGTAPLVPLLRMGISTKSGIQILMLLNPALWAGTGVIVARLIEVIQRRRINTKPNKALQAIGAKARL